MVHIGKLFGVLILWVLTVYADGNLSTNNGTVNTNSNMQLQSRISNISKSLEPYSRNRKNLTLNTDVSVRNPRGFADFTGAYDRYDTNVYGNNPGSPYNKPAQTESLLYSGSSTEQNVFRRQEDRSEQIADFPYPNFNPGYSNMFAMMQAMKKMDIDTPKPGLLARILDNPTTLVMATFIPISLLLAAVLPLLMNVMMNGITIPALISTTSGKARNLDTLNAKETLLTILDNLADFGSRYLDSPDCLHKVFCETTVNKTINSSDSYFLSHVVDTAVYILDDELLESFKMKPLMTAIKTRNCDRLHCSTKDEQSKPKIRELMDEIMFKHSLKTKPKKSS